MTTEIRYAAFFFAALTLVLGTDSLVFVLTAQHTIGRVTDVYSINARCGGGEGSEPHNCTVFEAGIEFAVGSIEQRVVLSAGSAERHGRSKVLSRYRIGDEVPVIFDSHNPARFYLPFYFDPFHWLWLFPSMTFAAMLISLNALCDKTPVILRLNESGIS